MSLERLGKFHKPLNMLKYNLFNKSIQLWFVPVPKSLQRRLKWSEPNWGELACSGLGRCISLHQVRIQLVDPASYSIVLDGIQLEAHNLTTSLLGPASCSHLLTDQQSRGLHHHPNDVGSCHLSVLTTLHIKLQSSHNLFNMTPANHLCLQAYDWDTHSFRPPIFEPRNHLTVLGGLQFKAPFGNL